MIVQVMLACGYGYKTSRIKEDAALFMRAHMRGVVMDRNRVVKSLLLTALFNTVIALFLSHLEYGEGFAVNLTVSQCIGLSICGAILAGHFVIDTGSRWKHFFMILATMSIGAVLGSLLGAALVGFPLKTLFQGNAAFQWTMSVILRPATNIPLSVRQQGNFSLKGPSKTLRNSWTRRFSGKSIGEPSSTWSVLTA